MPQLFGLGVTLVAVAVYFGFTFDQVRGLQRLQTEIVDRNRRDSLQLIRIQNDLYQIGLTLREAAESGDQYPLTGYHGALQALRTDLDDAIVQEHGLAPNSRTHDQQDLLEASLRRFWDEMDQMWMLASAGQDPTRAALEAIALEGYRSDRLSEADVRQLELLRLDVVGLQKQGVGRFRHGPRNRSEKEKTWVNALLRERAANDAFDKRALQLLPKQIGDIGFTSNKPQALPFLPYIAPVRGLP